MTETVFYTKRNGRYKPVSYHDSEVMDALPIGTHLIRVYKGGVSRRFNVDPAFAPMIAAGQHAIDAVSKKVMEASNIRPVETPLTQEQIDAWRHLEKVLGNGRLEHPAARDVAEAGVKAMQEEAEKLLKHPAVRNAWEQFQVIAKLAYEQNQVDK